MMKFCEISTATLEQLTEELAAAGQDSSKTNIYDARRSVAIVFNEVSDLFLYCSDTGEVITGDVTDEQAGESVQSVEGHIIVDGMTCYVGE